MFVQKRALQKIWQPSHSREDGTLFGGEKNPDYRETINTELCFFPICSKLHYFCIAELQACNGPITQFPITLSTHTHFKKTQYKQSQMSQNLKFLRLMTDLEGKSLKFQVYLI